MGCAPQRTSCLVSVDDIVEFLNMQGIFDIGTRVIDATTRDIYGRKHGNDILHRILSLKEIEILDRRATGNKLKQLPSQLVKCVAVDISSNESNDKDHRSEQPRLEENFQGADPKDPFKPTSRSPLDSNPCEAANAGPSSVCGKRSSIGQGDDERRAKKAKDSSSKAKVASETGPDMPGVMEKFRAVQEMIRNDTDVEEEPRFEQTCQETLRQENFVEQI